MIVTINYNSANYVKSVTIKREETDPVFSGVANAAGESRLLYHLKQKLNKMGFNFIKKRMWRDGHMVDDMQQYLRPRKIGNKPENNFCLFNWHWAICGLDEDLKKDGEITIPAYYLEDAAAAA